MVKKIWCAVLLAGFSCFTMRTTAGAIQAKSAVVIDADTGQVLYAYQEDIRLPMASTTKIMTALVALEEGELDREYTVKKEYTGVEGTSMYLREGETLTLRDTLYGLLLPSGNDAAIAIAGECGGLEAFVEKMNAKAQELGLTDTHFDNPNGLDGATHYTTAHELAKITAAAMQDPVFREIVSTQTYTIGDHVMANHNRLLSMYEGAIGVKTGFIKRSGRCLVSAAERNGRTLIAVTLNDPDDWNDHMAMLNDGFAQYQPVTLHQAGEQIAEQRVFGGDVTTVPLVAQQEVTAYVLPGETDQITAVRYGNKICYAPIIQSSFAGRVEYRLGNKTLASDTLTYGTGSVLLPEQKSLPERILERLVP